VHPENGVYDFPSIKQAIFKDGGFNLIAPQRPKNADIETYVTMLERWVRQLLEAGVPASRITIVGFSRGSYITALAAGRLKETGIHGVLAKRSHLTSFKEVAITTGKKHGAFFQPRPEWIDPLKAWIRQTNR
jgi:hypothetical protein